MSRRLRFPRVVPGTLKNSSSKAAPSRRVYNGAGFYVVKEARAEGAEVMLVERVTLEYYGLLIDVNAL